MNFPTIPKQITPMTETQAQQTGNFLEVKDTCI